MVAPVIFGAVLGMIEVGRGIMVVHLLNNAARAGCRVGILEGKSTNDITTAVNNTLIPVGIKSDTVTVQVNDGLADASTAQAGNEITVVVTVPVSKVTWLPGGVFLSGSLSGQYTLRRE
jgi:Flp pilus assembly protein TadG